MAAGCRVKGNSASGGESGCRLGHSEGDTTEEVFTEHLGLSQILARWCLLKGNMCPTEHKKVRARTAR